MSRDADWGRVKEIFLHAAELQAAQRSTYLEGCCEGNPALRNRVQALLDAGERGDPLSLLPGGSGASAGAAVSAGAELGRYRLERRIASGGMGDVWSAEDATLGRPAAIKLLQPAFTGDPAWIRRFEQEARTVSRLNHPNIMTVYDVGVAPPELGGVFYLAVELVEGRTLRELLVEGPLPASEALGIAIQVASALAAAHEASVVHRDIKPENIMIRPDGVVKVLDFGLAKATPAQAARVESRRDTIEGHVIGTPPYMAPERIRGGSADTRSDIFSLGVLLHEMIRGRLPFEGATTAEAFAAILTAEPVPLGREAPPALRDAVNRALAKDPARRYSTVRAFLSDLEAIRWSTNPHAVVAGRPSAWRRASSTAAVVLALGGGLAGAIGLWRRTLPEAPPTLIPFATFAGKKDFPSFSPDGNQIAFAWDGGQRREDTNKDIYIKLIGAGEPVRLTATPDEDEERPAWSPDGQQIAFLRSGWIYVTASLPGGPERRVARAGQGVSWSPDSERLAIATPPGRGVPGRIAIVSAATGEPLTQLTDPAPPQSDDQPAYSPNGKFISFFRSFGPTRRELFVIPASGGEARQLTFDKRQIHGLAWTGDSGSIVYASNRGGMRLWRIGIQGGTPQNIAVAGMNPVSPAISRQGNRLAFSEAYLDSNIYRYPGTAPGDPLVFQYSSREDHSPQYSPSGDQVVFVSMRSGSEELWLCSRDGRGLRQLTHIGGFPTGTPRWSPDGKWIAFDTRLTGDAEVFVADTGTGALRNFTNAPASYDATPSWSRDGRWIYFASSRGGSGTDIWKQPAEGGETVRLTHDGGSAGIESDDGKTFYFSKGRGHRGLWQIPAAGGPERLVDGLETAGDWRSWGVSRRGIHFAGESKGRRHTVQFFEFLTKKIETLFSIGENALWSHPALAVSPDGREFLVAREDHALNEIMLVDNFR